MLEPAPKGCVSNRDVRKTKAPARGILRAQIFDASLLRQGGQLCQTFFALGFKGFRKPEVRVASTAGFGGKQTPAAGFLGFREEATPAKGGIS